MQCPHCGFEIREIKGPNCPKCGRPLLGRDAELQAQEDVVAGVKMRDLDTEEASAAVGQATVEPPAISLEEAVRRAARGEPVAPPQPEAETEQIEAAELGRVDLDAEEAGLSAASVAAAEEAGRLDPTVFLTREQVSERHRTRMLEQAAIEAHVATIAWGAYVGAALGAAGGYFAGDWAHKLVQTAAGALAGAILGYLLGLLVGGRVAEATRRERGAQVIVVVGTIFVVTVAFTPIVWAFIWGVKNYVLWTLATYLVVGFAFFTWVFQDANHRRAAGAVKWGLLAWVFPPSVVAYLNRRPPGELVDCANPECRKKYLSRLERCPHCGFRSEADLRRLEM